MAKEREVIINDRTSILTTSDDPDDIVREKYIAKINRNKDALNYLNGMGKPSFGKGEISK